MNVLINGAGNIGKTLAALLAKHKDLLSIQSIYLHKNIMQPWLEEDLAILESMGIHVLYNSLEQIMPHIHYVFDATANGIGIKNKEIYKSADNLIGACAQGSEKEFGISYMCNINDNAIAGQPFVHIVSCNTHGALSILNACSNEDFSMIKKADFVVVRRSEDISNHERLVTANVVARHLHPDIGTHHAIDVVDLLKTINISIPITSSDITTPSQLMHSSRFSITLRKPIDVVELTSRLKKASLISLTKKFDSNTLFEMGRRYGEQGRLYMHSIVIENNIMIHGDTIIGWAFIPQEGNTIVSTIKAFLLQTNSTNTKFIYNEIVKDLLFTSKRL